MSYKVLILFLHQLTCQEKQVTKQQFKINLKINDTWALFQCSELSLNETVGL